MSGFADHHVTGSELTPWLFGMFQQRERAEGEHRVDRLVHDLLDPRPQLLESPDREHLVARIRERVAIIKPAMIHDIIERAAARGEVREKLPARARTLPIDLMRNELLQNGPDIPLSVIEEIVDDVFLPLVRA